MLLLYPIVSSGNKVCKAVEVLKEHQVMMKMIMMIMIMLKMMLVMVIREESISSKMPMY